MLLLMTLKTYTEIMLENKFMGASELSLEKRCKSFNGDKEKFEKLGLELLCTLTPLAYEVKFE